MTRIMCYHLGVRIVTKRDMAKSLCGAPAITGQLKISLLTQERLPTDEVALALMWFLLTFMVCGDVLM